VIDIGLFTWLFGEKCEHSYQKIDTEYKVYPNFNTRQYEVAEYYILYCPKCNREKRVDATKYDREKQKERLRKNV